MKTKTEAGFAELEAQALAAKEAYQLAVESQREGRIVLADEVRDSRNEMHRTAGLLAAPTRDRDAKVAKVAPKIRAAENDARVAVVHATRRAKELAERVAETKKWRKSAPNTEGRAEAAQILVTLEHALVEAQDSAEKAQGVHDEALGALEVALCQVVADGA